MLRDPAGPTEPGPITSWVLTDGKAGDENQCLGVATALGMTPEIRRVRPRPPFTWAMPWGPIDPRERPGAHNSPIVPPFPDLLIASGRRAVPYCAFVKRATGGRTFTVFLKDPRTGAGAADFIWVSEHDRLRGPNVLATLTPPHGILPGRLAAARAAPDPRLAGLPRPRVAVLVGGSSRHHRFTDADVSRFQAQLETLAKGGAGLMISASRRTPDALKRALAGLAATHGGFFWDGTGPNPFLAMLALADALVVTADSTNMVGEAAATGRPILLFEPQGGHPKFTAFLNGLKGKGIVHPFTGSLVGDPYPPLNATLEIAAAIAERWNRHRRALGLPAADLAPETP
ncbi:mitochondrial fission ELM1 family protein [Microvirga pudoricolor]|uniref:mitochondrial fission ELM1 family protein n=1 Tax=Microvirga pudoricolor TaxID=2778729 RepID=UPI0019521E33|nr:mitochondrial fission ELM1 family protein [Microvirga pudoricolor]MBM6592451.1 mitochondrial fission ELM1 family protein [Microvirga pudoricolor]